MNELQQRERFTALIVFKGADHRRAWRMFTKRGWRHCFVIVPAYYPEPGLMADAYSVILNQSINCTKADVVFDRPENVAKSMLKSGAKCVIKFRIDRTNEPNYVPRGILTCVSLTKSILGISAWFVWTPEHLARWLLRNGGNIMTFED